MTKVTAVAVLANELQLQHMTLTQDFARLIAELQVARERIAQEEPNFSKLVGGPGISLARDLAEVLGMATRLHTLQNAIATIKQAEGQ